MECYQLSGSHTVEATVKLELRTWISENNEKELDT